MNAEPGEANGSQRNELLQLAQEANEKLESAGQDSANQAFNLGCWVGVLPSAVLLGVIFILSRGNMVTALIAATLLVISVLVFASLASFRAKTNAIKRTYQRDIAPEIERTLRRLELSRAEFEQQATSILPEGAVLRDFMEPPGLGEPAPEET